MAQTYTQRGIIIGLAAYVWWGLSSLYWRALDPIDPMDIIAHRALWTLPVALAAVVLTGSLRETLVHLRQPKILALMLVSTVLISSNWFLFVMSVSTGKLADAGLGYFLLPLVNVVMGVMVFRERPDMPETLAILMAAVGFAVLLTDFSSFPWIALGVSLTFGLYGVLRKAAPIDSVGGMFVEALILSPFALSWMVLQQGAGLGSGSSITDVLLIGAGLVTAIPLIAYASAARQMTMITLGMIFYINPTIQLIIAVFIFDEALPVEKQIAFASVWLGLIILTLGKNRQRRNQHKAA